ncbi:MAG: sensor histidine kinase [Planctomycetota bacterium]
MPEQEMYAQLLRRLVRLVEGVGSYTDAEVLAHITRELVREFGLEGAAIWRISGGEPVLEYAKGRSIEEAFIKGALEGKQEAEDHVAWPLRVGREDLGVLAVRGAITDPVRLLTGMLAGRCAHILNDARRATTQRTLLEGLSHELRAPLQAMLGHVDLLRSGAFGPLTDDQAEALEAVAGSAERILSVARDVLQVARIDAGRDQVIVGEVALDEILHREVDVIRPLAERAGLELRVDCPSNLLVTSDGAKIARIVTNLISNAIKYTPKGLITVRGGPRTGGFFAEVMDTGVGIPSTKQRAVFEEYVRLDGAGEGTGLGLAIARRLANLLEGRLTLESKVGEGTTVRLELPA